MNHSRSNNTVIITSAAERKVKHNFNLIRINSTSLRRGGRDLDAYQEDRMEKVVLAVLPRDQILYGTGGNERCALLQVSGNNRRVNTVLGEGSSSLLIRRPVRTDLLISRGLRFSSISLDTITIPRSDLSHTLIIIDTNLVGWYQLKPNSVDLHFIKQAREVRVLGNLPQNFNHVQEGTTSSFTSTHRKLKISAILQAEPRQISLLKSSGKVRHSRTTGAVETRTPVPSVGTGSGTTVTTVGHFWEWWWHHFGRALVGHALSHRSTLP